MKKSILFGLLALLLTACGVNSQESNREASDSAESAIFADSASVNIYYFHGKQRCKTCVAVGDVTEKVIKELYADNPHVRFIEVKTDEKQHVSLVEKYEVTWNALIIAKGDNHVEITKEAFANALNSPEKLTGLIKTEVDKRL